MAMGGWDLYMDEDGHRIVERYENGKWTQRGTVSVGDQTKAFYWYSTVTINEYLFTFGKFTQNILIN